MTETDVAPAARCRHCGDPIPLDHAQVGGVHMQCEHAYFHEKSVLMCNIRPAECGGSWLVCAPSEVASVLINGDEDETWEIKMTKMSKGEIEALPEHDGW